MWYVLRAMTGKENEICLWINAFMDKSCYSRCFVPLYEEVRKHKGIGEIFIKRLFSGYVFIESESPKQVYQELNSLYRLYTMEEKRDTKKAEQILVEDSNSGDKGRLSAI